MQVVLPGSEYFPGGQLAHVVRSAMLLFLAPIRANIPTLQLTGPVQADVERPCVDPYVPAGHSVHEMDPANEYSPG